MSSLLLYYSYFQAVWNYDSYVIKTVAQNAFNSMLAVAGKLWCAYANTITILNPSNLNVEVNFILFNLK